MRSLAELRALSDLDDRARDFLTIAQLVLKADAGDALHRLRMAEATGAPARVVQILKTAVSAGSISDANFASEIAAYKIVTDAFVALLRNRSVFDRILADGALRRVPLRSKISVTTVGASGNVVAGGSSKPISQLAFDTVVNDVLKATAIVIASQELLTFGPAAQRIFERELVNGVGAATDQEFISKLLEGVTPVASSGTALANVVADLGVLLSRVVTGATSRVYMVFHPHETRQIVAGMCGESSNAFRNFGLSGGEVLPGIEGVVSDVATQGEVICFDADGLVGDSDVITLDQTRQAMIQMADSVDSPPSASTVMRSLWQHNERGLKCERSFGFEKSRDNCVAALTGVDWFPIGSDSPA